MVLSKGEVCDDRKVKLIKEQQSSRLLSSSGIKTDLLYQIFFCFRAINILVQDIK